jgi:hypothetical protein
MTKTHELKCWPGFFREIYEERKRFEVRYNDRDFHEGDELILREWEPNAMKYTGRVIGCDVGFILPGGTFGIEKGFVVMSLMGIEEIDPTWSDSESNPIKVD